MTSETCYDAGRRCCPSDGETCGGTTCCQPGAICCPSSSSGCCIGGAVCCRSSTNPCCPGGSTCCGDTCCREGETCSAGGCINEEFIRTNRVVRFAYDELRNGALLRNMCRATRFMNTVTLEYAKAENAIQKSEIRRTAFIGGCRDGFCGAVTERGTCNEFPPAMTDEAVQGVWPISRQVISCIPQNQNTYQGAVFNNMIRRSEIVQGQGFALAMDCDGVRTALDDGIGADEGSLTETRENGVSGELNEYPPLEFFDQTTGLIVVGFGDLGPGSYSAEVTIDEGSAEIAYIVDNLGDELAAVADRLRAGDTQTLTWEVSPDGELMGVGLVIPTLVNGTKVSWKFQETGPPSTTGTRGRGSQTTIRGGSSTGSPDDFFTGGAFQMVVNREFWKGVVGMAALGVVLVWI
ncbi:hypothetical protein CC2G_003578 [Coprinopsis cinerea AmutBmut pab1-1]|nr:hypothetical protein CC2G_003578 [Coprinopsis cinerea AmutBmut pab1-1]